MDLEALGLDCRTRASQVLRAIAMNGLRAPSRTPAITRKLWWILSKRQEPSQARWGMSDSSSLYHFLPGP
jgi:hypothetical protein